MANLTLAPEEDEPLFSLNLEHRFTKREQIDARKMPMELRRLHGQFDPQKVGFGIIAPWPGTEQAIRTKEFVDPRDADVRSVTDADSDRTSSREEEQE
jgi:hypothetical protein